MSRARRKLTFQKKPETHLVTRPLNPKHLVKPEHVAQSGADIGKERPTGLGIL